MKLELRDVNTQYFSLLMTNVNKQTNKQKKLISLRVLAKQQTQPTFILVVEVSYINTNNNKKLKC